MPSFLYWHLACCYSTLMRRRYGSVAFPHRAVFCMQKVDPKSHLVLIVSFPPSPISLLFHLKCPCSYELIGTFLHLPGGIVATTIRFTISYFDMAVAFGRLDVPISASHPASDQGHSAYMAAVLCDIKFNSPFSRFYPVKSPQDKLASCHGMSVMLFICSVLAHDVAAMLTKSRRNRQKLGAALEKVLCVTHAQSMPASSTSVIASGSCACQ